MKKISLLVLSIATAFAATAQVSVLKEAERAMKNGTEGAKVEEAIKPAFTDPETATMAQTWYIPGKAYFQDFDKMYKLRTINPNDPSATPAKMGDALVNCFEYYIKALPLDSVADKKGKIKTKYSKEIYKTLGAWVDDLSGLGGDMFNSHDYAGAAEAWKLTADLLTNPEVTKNRAQGAPADSIIGQTYNNLALASYFNKDIPGALQAYRDATKHDYKKLGLYDNAIKMAQEGNDNEAALAFATEALDLYGDQSDVFMGVIVNYYLQKKDFDKAFEIINQAIAKNPNNAQYYVIQGVLYENQDNNAQAKEAYAKAKQLDPRNAQAVYNYGRMLYNEAAVANDNAPATPAEYDAYFTNTVAPMFTAAAETLEEAYKLDQELNPEFPNSDILKYLEVVYYVLRDDAKYNDVQERKKM